MGRDSRKAKQQALTPPRQLWLIRLLLLVAAGVDGYLLSVSAAGGAVAGCGPESNCHVVLNSRWAYWLSVPVSAPALIVYALLFTGTFWLDGKSEHSRRGAWRILFPGAVAVLGAGLWFVGLQLFVLQAICPYCMTAHACGMAAAGLLAWGAWAPGATQRKPSGEPPSRLNLAPLAAVGCAVVVVLVAGQALYQPRTYVVTPISAGVTTNTPAALDREFQILDGKFQFRLNEVPLIGRPEAEHVMVSLFDYTCHHCRQVHPLLVEAQRHFSNQLVIVNVPMPLDAKCNRLIRRPLPAHTNACALARIGLTVWRADRKKAPAFDEWVFEPANPPLPSAAEAYARQLVGADAFDHAATNSWVDERIREDIAIYEAVYRKFRKSAMPQAIIGTNLISGVFSRDQLLGMLAEQFGLTNSSHAPAP